MDGCGCKSLVTGEAEAMVTSLFVAILTKFEGHLKRENADCLSVKKQDTS